MNNEQLIVIMYTMLGIQLGIYSLIGIGIVFVHRKVTSSAKAAKNLHLHFLLV